MSAPPDPNASETAEPLLFDAVLVPHRSLEPAGFWLLMAVVSAVSFVSGMYFVLRGAWPVFGYFGLDVLLLYLAFRASYRSARFCETIRLGADALVVERLGPRGRRARWSFQPYWLKVEIDEPPQHGSQLRLTSHGRSLVVGAFLPPGERYEVAQALRAALSRQREGRNAGDWAAAAEHG